MKNNIKIFFSLTLMGTQLTHGMDEINLTRMVRVDGVPFKLTEESIVQFGAFTIAKDGMREYISPEKKLDFPHLRDGSKLSKFRDDIEWIRTYIIPSSICHSFELTSLQRLALKLEKKELPRGLFSQYIRKHQ